MQSIDLSAYRKIALIADTHGPVHDELVEKISQHDCIVHAGDSGGLEQLGLAHLPLFAVLGNNDTAARWPLSERATLADLPRALNLGLQGGSLAVIHGHQFPALKSRHQKLCSQFPYAKAVLYGHSHRPVIDKNSKPWILNPGAAGRVRAYDSAGFISMNVGGGRWRLDRIRVG